MMAAAVRSSIVGGAAARGAPAGIVRSSAYASPGRLRRRRGHLRPDVLTPSPHGLDDARALLADDEWQWAAYARARSVVDVDGVEVRSTVCRISASPGPGLRAWGTSSQDGCSGPPDLADDDRLGRWARSVAESLHARASALLR